MSLSLQNYITAINVLRQAQTRILLHQPVARFVSKSAAQTMADELEDLKKVTTYLEEQRDDKVTYEQDELDAS